jgi:predicted double-glycine peptidase
LPVPYVSQLGTVAEAHSNDSGAASAIMLLRAYQKSIMTPDEFYTQFNISGDPFLSVSQIQSAMNRMGLLTEFRAGLTMPDLFNLIASSKPAIVLIRYKVLFEAGLTEKSFQGPHFAVVVGLDPKYIYIHDPLYTNPLVGEAHAYPIDTFWQAWKETAIDPSFPNRERSAIIPTSGLGFQVSRKVKVNIASLNVRTGPGINNPQIGTVKKNDVLAVSHEVNGWGEIGFNQWIKLSYTVDV